MNTPAFAALLGNGAFLLALVALYVLFARTEATGARKRLRQIASGVAAGLLGIALMQSAYVLKPGIIFDTRSVLLSLCGLFFGAVPTWIAMGMTAAFRLYQGGTAVWTGLAVIFATGGVGLLWRGRFSKSPTLLSAGRIYLFGIGVHVIMLALMFLMPWETAWVVVSRIGLPVLLIYPAVTLGVALLLQRSIRQQQTETALQTYESTHRNLFENDHVVMLLVDPRDGSIADANPAACAFYGWDRQTLRGMNIREINTLPPEQITKKINQVVEGACRHFQFRHRLADGSEREVDVLSGPISLDGRDLIHSIILDNTQKRKEADEQSRQLQQAQHARRALLSVVEDQKLAKAALQDSEKNFRHLADMAKVVISIVADKYGESYLYVNNEWSRVLGYSRDEARTLRPIDLIAPDCRRLVLDHAANRIGEKPSPAYYEVRAIAKNGAIKHLDFSSTTITFAGQKAFLTTAIDITDRKRAEAALLRQSALLEAISETAGILLAEQDVRKAINQTLARVGEASGQDRVYIFETHPDERTGEPLMSQRYEWVREGISAQIGNPDLQNLPFSQSCPRWHEQLSCGAPLHGAVSSFPPAEQADLSAQNIVSLLVVPINVNTHFWGFIGFDNCHAVYDWSPAEIDILKTVAANIASALARHTSTHSLRQLSTAIEQSPEAVVITDVEGIIEYVNPAFETVTGHTRESTIGKTPRILRSGKHDDRFYSNLWKTLRSGDTWEGRFINRHKNGSLYTEQTSIAPVRDADGTITHFVAVKRDITGELEREQQAMLSQKMEAVGQLAGGVAHDFNNILQTILGFSELLLVQTETSEELPRSMILEIQKASSRAADLTRQLLTFSRKQPPKISRFDLNNTIQEALPMLSGVVGESIRIAVHLAPEPMWIEADVHQIERSILNMTLNARDAMPAGGVLTLKTESVEALSIEGAAERDAPEDALVCLTISDTGVGMTEAVLVHIFEPFFTTKTVGKGTGLGLAATYGIIQEHKGWIHVDSVPGKGSTFKVYLPRRTDPVEQKPQTVKPETMPMFETELSANARRILVVEDNPDLCNLSKTVLSRAGYDVECAPDAETAERIFHEKNGAFDLLFSDVILTGKNGAKLASELTREKPSLAVILCSGYSGNRIENAGVDPEKFVLLEKPFPMASLLKTVHQLLENLNGKKIESD